MINSVLAHLPLVIVSVVLTVFAILVLRAYLTLYAYQKKVRAQTQQRKHDDINTVKQG